MNQCVRGKKNTIAVWIIIVIFGLLGFSNIYMLFEKKERFIGELFIIMDEREQTIMALIGIILFLGIAISLIIHMCQTKDNKILYDECCVVFYFNRDNERKITWSQFHDRFISVFLGNTVQALIFVFEDGKQMEVTRAYNGFEQLYRTLWGKGIPIRKKKNKLLKINKAENKIMGKGRQKLFKTLILMFSILSAVFFVLGMLKIFVFKVEPVPFDANGLIDVYCSMDVYYVEPLAWEKADYEEKEYYFYTTYNNKLCVFTLTESDEKKWGSILYQNAQKLYYGDESFFDESPVLRIQGYTVSHHKNIVEMITIKWGISQELFYSQFGNTFLSNRQSSNMSWGFIMIAFLFFSASNFLLARYRNILRQSQAKQAP